MNGIKAQRICTDRSLIANVQSSKQTVQTYNPEQGLELTLDQLKQQLEAADKQTMILTYLKCQKHCHEAISDIGDGTAFMVDLTNCPAKIIDELKILVSMSKSKQKMKSDSQ